MPRLPACQLSDCIILVYLIKVDGKPEQTTINGIFNFRGCPSSACAASPVLVQPKNSFELAVLYLITLKPEMLSKRHSKQSK